MEAIRISTVFNDQSYLEKIAERLMAKGTISGFTIDQVNAGYAHEGKQVTEAQYKLEILTPASGEEDLRAEVEAEVHRSIGEKWDVPAITEERVRVNEDLLRFVKRAGTEHRRYIKERRFRTGIILTAALSFLSLAGLLIKEYGESKARAAVKQEQKLALDNLDKLREKLEHDVMDLNAKIESGDKLTGVPNDMAAVGSFEETEKVIHDMRNFEQALKDAQSR